MAGEVATLTNESVVADQVRPELEVEHGIITTDFEVMPVLQIDAEFKGLMYPLTPDEFECLKESIKTEGLRDRLTVWKGHNTLLDGHHRWAICEELGIVPETREIDLPDRLSAKIWVLNNQRSRRNLTDSQRAMLAVDLEKLYASRAKARMGGRTDLGQNFDQDKGEFGRSAEKAGKAMGVSHASVSYAKKVVQKGIPELEQIVKTGGLSVSAAAKVADLLPDDQMKVIEVFETRLKEGKKPHVASIIQKISPPTKPEETKFDKAIKQVKAALDKVSQIPSPRDAIAKIDGLIRNLEAVRDRLTSLEEVKEHLQNSEASASLKGISVDQSRSDADTMGVEA